MREEERGEKWRGRAPFGPNSVEVNIYSGHSFPVDFWDLGKVSTQQMCLKAECEFLFDFYFINMHQ